MGKMKDLVIEICDLYDRQGMTIIQIASYMDMTKRKYFRLSAITAAVLIWHKIAWIQLEGVLYSRSTISLVDCFSLFV